MNRLRDDVGDDPVAERGINLLRAYAATPADSEMKRRVWAGIQQTRLRAVAPQSFRRLRFVAACVVVLGLAGTAGAVITQRWIVPERARTAEPAKERTGPAPRARIQRQGRGTVAEGAIATGAVSSDASGGVPVIGGAIAAAAEPMPAPRLAGPRRASAPLARARDRAVSRAPVTGPRVAAAAVDRAGPETGASETPPEAAIVRERTQVLDALIALRRDHDGARAGVLLDEYLAGFPRGVLREEALVLAIEAADARGDGTSARRLARSYEAAYPSGRFSAFARRRAVAGTP